MNIQHLQYFLSVMDTGSFSASGKQCFTSQSNISKSIKSLEKEFGYQLFYRTKEGVTPTREAVVLAGKLRNLVSTLEAVCADPLKDEIQDFYLAVSQNMSLQHIVPNFLKDIGEQRQFQNIKFHIQYAEPADIVKGLIENRFNLGFVYSPYVITHPGLERLSLTRANQAIYYSVHDPAGQKNELHVENFSSSTFGMLSGNDWNRVWDCLPFTPKKIIQAENLSDLYLYVESGLCVAVLGPSQSLLHNNSVKRLPLENGAMVGTDMVWNTSNSSSSLQKVLVYMKELAKDLQKQSE